MAEWITAVITAWGPLGVAFLMFLENVFPPIPSEVILPLAGAAAAKSGASVIPTILAASAGSLAGVTVWFVAARAFGKARVLVLTRRLGRIMTVTPAEVERAQIWFGRYGHLAVFFGRLVPTVRTLISIPAGLASMGWGRFLLFSALGSLIWSGLLILAGHWLGEQGGVVEGWISPVSDAVLILVAAIYLWRVVTWKPDR